MSWPWFSSLPVSHKVFFVLGLLIVTGGIIAIIVCAATGKFHASSSNTIRPTVTVPIISTISPPEFTACASEKCFNVGNTCPFPLWIHAVNNPTPPAVATTLLPDMRKLLPGEAVQMEVPNEWSAGRVNAYYKEPTTNPLAFDKVEMTVTAAGIINYDITYVDYIALPSQITPGPEATNCNPSNSTVSCPVRVENILNGCPYDANFDLLDPDTSRCLSAGLYCSNPANVGKAFCHMLDAKLAECTNPANAELYPYCNMGSNDTTANVYSCSGYFDGQAAEGHTDGNRWCAALNRNMLNDSLGTDTEKYYQGTEMNQYAKWIHTTCPGIYAFAYDDFPPGAEASGDRSCETNRLDILFCPANSH